MGDGTSTRLVGTYSVWIIPPCGQRVDAPDSHTTVSMQEQGFEPPNQMSLRSTSWNPTTERASYSLPRFFHRSRGFHADEGQNMMSVLLAYMDDLLENLILDTVLFVSYHGIGQEGRWLL